MISHQDIQQCIEECLACAQVCEECISGCLNEADVNMMTRCIELDRECTLICYATAQLMAMNGENAGLLCDACADICETCAEECAKHDAEHCRRCAEACRRCAETCRKMATEEV